MGSWYKACESFIDKFYISVPTRAYILFFTMVIPSWNVHRCRLMGSLFHKQEQHLYSEIFD